MIKSVRTFWVFSPQELVRDLQDTHKTENNYYATQLWTRRFTWAQVSYTEVGLYSVKPQQSVSTSPHLAHLWRPCCRRDSPWTFSVSFTLSFNPSILSSVLLLVSSPLCQYSGTPRQENLRIFSRNSPTSTFHLNDWWSFNCSWRPK